MAFIDKEEGLMNAVKHMADQQRSTPERILQFMFVGGDSPIDIPMLNLVANAGGLGVMFSQLSPDYLRELGLSDKVHIVPEAGPQGVQRILKTYLQMTPHVQPQKLITADISDEAHIKMFTPFINTKEVDYAIATDRPLIDKWRDIWDWLKGKSRPRINPATVLEKIDQTVVIVSVGFRSHKYLAQLIETAYRNGAKAVLIVGGGGLLIRLVKSTPLISRSARHFPIRDHQLDGNGTAHAILNDSKAIICIVRFQNISRKTQPRELFLNQRTHILGVVHDQNSSVWGKHLIILT
jgi:hypothetical protein